MSGLIFLSFYRKIGKEYHTFRWEERASLTFDGHFLGGRLFQTYPPYPFGSVVIWVFEVQFRRFGDGFPGAHQVDQVDQVINLYILG